MTSPIPKPSSRNLWPIAIIAYFIIFISAMVIWIVFAVKQDMQLVRTDYYEEEIRYQRHIDSAKRAAMLPKSAEVNAIGDQVLIRLPSTAQPPSKVSVHLYRPSDARLDRVVSLKPLADVPQLAAFGLAPGLWKVRLTWTVGGEDYVMDKTIVIGS